MLKDEQIRAELTRLKNEKWTAGRITAADALPENLRLMARSILDAEDTDESDQRERKAARRKETTKAFREMDEPGRLTFFETMAPGLGAIIESGWKLFVRLPFQSAFERKPFRAPDDPGVLINRRVNWLLQLLGLIGPYQQNIAWLAAWAPHIAPFSNGDVMGLLLAAAIDRGGSDGEEVFQILCAAGRNEHEVGGMGRHVTRALLSASRPEGWEFVEKMLLAAQREEGLRQTILETVDEAHPEAFRRMLRLILDHNLARFSSTVRAFDAWLGYQWDSVSAGVVNRTIEKMLLYLEDPAARDVALKGRDAEQVYLALWISAFENAVAVVPIAAELLKHPNAEHRFVATHLLDQLRLVSSQRALLAPLEDADLRVTTRALECFQRAADDRVKKSDLFERLEKLVERYPEKPEKLKPAVWPWTEYTISKELVTDTLPDNLAERPPSRLIPHLRQMGVYKRAAVIKTLGRQDKWDTATRETLFALVGDASRPVRETALEQLAKCQVTPEEAEGIEKLLDRKTGDLRRAGLTLLARLPDDQALASADRLLAAKSPPQRLAGLELLRQMFEAKRCLTETRARAEHYSAAHPKLNDAERQQLDMVLAVGIDVPTLDNALGLLNHNERTWPPAPVNQGVQFYSPIAARLVAAMEQILVDNAQRVVSFKKPDGEVWTGLLSDLGYGYTQPDPKLSVADDRERFPMADIWEPWWRDRGPELRDADGMEVLRALALVNFFCKSYGDPAEAYEAFPEMARRVFGEKLPAFKTRPHLHRGVLLWLLKIFPPAGAAEFSLSAGESAMALVPADALCFQPGEQEELGALEVRCAKGDDDGEKIRARIDAINARTSWRETATPHGLWLTVVEDVFSHPALPGNSPLHVRRWKLLRWMDEPVRPVECGGNSGMEESRCIDRQRSDLVELCLARAADGATDADIIEQLLGDRVLNVYNARRGFRDLRFASARKPKPELLRFEFLFPLMERCRRRVLEVELTRGDNPTAASSPALSLSSVTGAANVTAILRVLGQRNFVRGHSGDNQSTETVLSHLVRCCFPLADETAADFNRQVKAANITPERLVELAVYAPQWAAFVESTLAWDQLTEAVWWIHAHTKGSDWTVDREIRELWQADINSRTSLTADDLLEGGVDVAWFQRVYNALGKKRWETVYEAAKFASTGAGHARARMFADAMLGSVSKKEIVQRITKKRQQDAVRALGLLPLAAVTKRDADLLDRYKVIQEFRRGSKEFGSQRQASEKRAAQIGQQNLARTAGYADPIRLEWAMEAKAVEDLADGPIAVTVDDVTVSLGIDAWGEIELTVTKDGKTIADVPAKLKKDPKIAAVRARKVELKRQASRIRPSLEQFMIRGDEFVVAELCELMEHPLLAPMLKNLVIVGDGIMGYPVHGGKALENHAGEIEAIKVAEKLRIAHPHDLLPAAAWHKWQKDCFARERIQPFKQVFRELYPLTETEKKDGTLTRRYAGHQVRPRQALALLGQRGWVHHPDEGVRKVYHDAGLVAWLGFQEGFFTPAEIEGLTLENVFFTRRGDSTPVKLEQIPRRLFSETMRDLDLVVSVAHRGGVDPEASASTIEMRSTLIGETTRLLKLKNVKLKHRYALITGAFGEYSVHLGSAVTRKMPGEMLFIVAVHSQHRGRLFLPFADDDPRTAEVMSKILLLARDNEIKDPGILDQIRQS